MRSKKRMHMPVSEVHSIEASSGLSLSLGNSLFGIRSTSTRSWDEKHIDSLVGSTLLASSSPTNDDAGIRSGDRSALLLGVGVSIGDLSDRMGFSMGDLSDRTTPEAAADEDPDEVSPALSVGTIGPTLGELIPMRSRLLVASRTGDEVPLSTLVKLS